MTPLRGARASLRTVASAVTRPQQPRPQGSSGSRTPAARGFCRGRRRTGAEGGTAHDHRTLVSTWGAVPGSASGASGGLRPGPTARLSPGRDRAGLRRCLSPLWRENRGSQAVPQSQGGPRGHGCWSRTQAFASQSADTRVPVLCPRPFRSVLCRPWHRQHLATPRPQQARPLLPTREAWRLVTQGAPGPGVPLPLAQPPLLSWGPCSSLPVATRQTSPGLSADQLATSPSGQVLA